MKKKIWKKTVKIKNFDKKVKIKFSTINFFNMKIIFFFLHILKKIKII